MVHESQGRVKWRISADVDRVLDRFGKDYLAIAESTGLHTRDYAAGVVNYLKLLAGANLLARVDIVLRNASGVAIRAAKYAASLEADGWSTMGPGDNRWPVTPGSGLEVVIVPPTIDVSYAGLTGEVDSRYVSQSYGLERTFYR